jgi:hypothetical protein
MPGKAESGEKAQCTCEYMSILSRFPTQHGAAREFFSSLLGVARALRIEFAGALYHVTARGDVRRSIFSSDDDLSRLLDMTLSRAMKRVETTLRQEQRNGQWVTPGEFAFRCKLRYASFAPHCLVVRRIKNADKRSTV